MSGIEEVGPQGSPDAATDLTDITAAPPTTVSTNDLIALPQEPWLPHGLTEDGRSEFFQVLQEANSRTTRRLTQELTLQWMSIGRDGPATYTWDRVRDAESAIKEKDRREIEAEINSRITTETFEEQRKVRAAREISARRSRWRWYMGSTMSTATTAIIAVMAVPGGNLWTKTALVLANATGVLISWPPRSND